MFKPFRKLLFSSLIGLALIILLGASCNLQKATNKNSESEEKVNANAKVLNVNAANVNQATITDKITVGSVENDFADLEKQQSSVDSGSQPWRLDPLTVAITESPKYGFDASNDTFSLTEKIELGEFSGTGEATVEAVHQAETYNIQLIQPVKQGSQGIWAINSISKK